VFEDSFFPRRPEGRNRAARLVPLIFSLILHGFLVYGIYHARFTIKMLPVGTTVRDIRIVPPPRPALPRIVGPLRPTPAKPGPPEEGPAETGTGGRTRPAAVEPGPPGGTASPPSSAPPPAAGPVIASLATDFQKSMSSRLKSGKESDLTVVLSPPGTKPEPGTPGPARTNFYDYIPGTVGSGGAGTGTGGGGAGSGGAQRAGISIPLKDYNLAPWAQKVLERIIQNWEIPGTGGLRSRAAVKVVVMVKKDGQVASIEFVEGTALDALDEAALAAIRSSLPLPALPDDFPGDLLEAVIEFVYHD
jgi:TonB family protein